MNIKTRQDGIRHAMEREYVPIEDALWKALVKSCWPKHETNPAVAGEQFQDSCKYMLLYLRQQTAGEAHGKKTACTRRRRRFSCRYGLSRSYLKSALHRELVAYEVELFREGKPDATWADCLSWLASEYPPPKFWPPPPSPDALRKLCDRASARDQVVNAFFTCMAERIREAMSTEEKWQKFCGGRKIPRPAL